LKKSKGDVEGREEKQRQGRRRGKESERENEDTIHRAQIS
jgi:hypothetical protein